MKIALVHDWFNQRKGGGEKVAFTLAQAYPEAPIFTLIFNKEKFAEELEPSRVKTSFLQRMPGWMKKHPRYLLPLIPFAVKNLKLQEEVVLSSSFAFVKNISVPDKTLHICYCHTPMRFAWDYRDQYMQEQNVGFLQKILGKLLRDIVQRWDIRNTSSVDYFIANSHTVAKRIEHYYGRVAKVIYPPVETTKLKSGRKQGYYITLGMLTPYKKIDLVVEAFNRSGKQLKIIGEGPEMEKLKAVANKNIEFTGFVSEVEKIKLLAGANGLVFPNKEDFGIAMVEALASGTPVVAYAQGGATEIVTPKTGVLFEEQTPEAVNQAIETMESRKLKVGDLQARAKEFSEQRFIREIKAFVKEKHREHVDTEQIS